MKIRYLAIARTEIREAAEFAKLQITTLRFLPTWARHLGWNFAN
jgi:hypothetical protein